MIPLGDEYPTVRAPVMTYAILAGMLATWVFVQGAGFSSNDVKLVTSVCNLGMVPGELTHLARLGTAVPVGDGLACVVDNEPINWLTPLTSMFLHGGWGHLLGNMLFFWVFGKKIEDSMGSIRFFFFYIVCGLAAAGVHIFMEPASPIPTVGASGAISGVLGAYLVLYPRVKVKMLFFFLLFFRIIPIPAWMVLIWWFFWQVITALPDLMSVRPDVSGGVAVWAHIGGFVAGMLLVKIFEDRRLVRQRIVRFDTTSA
jgi:membrane associated rhomboid family serine protease